MKKKLLHALENIYQADVTPVLYPSGVGYDIEAVNGTFNITATPQGTYTIGDEGVHYRTPEAAVKALLPRLEKGERTTIYLAN